MMQRANQLARIPVSIDKARHPVQQSNIAKTIADRMIAKPPPPMQQAIRDALIAFMAASAQAQAKSHQGRSGGRHRAR